MLPIALIVDEAALTNDEEKAGLVEMVERERDTGFYPVLATNRPEASALLVKTNLVTRICFPVPSWNASNMVLGVNGAEALPKEQGRGLIVFKARVTEFQSFRVTYPDPSEETVRMMLERDQVEATIIEPTENKVYEVSEVQRLAEQIRGQWTPDLSGSAVARLLGLSQYGGSYKARIDKVVAYLTSTLYSTTPKEAEMPDLGAVGA